MDRPSNTTLTFAILAVLVLALAVIAYTNGVIVQAP